MLIARHFQYRVEGFFRQIFIDGSFGKTKHYDILVEFQVSGEAFTVRYARKYETFSAE